MQTAMSPSKKTYSQLPAWLLSVLLLTVAYGLLGLTFTQPLSHASIMQRCVLVDPNRARIWSVGNIEIGLAYLGVFGGMTWYFVNIFRRNRAHLIDLGIATLYLAASFLLDFLCVQHFHPFTALLVGDAIVMTFTVIVSRQLWFQRLLGVFVPIIFLTCGIGHFLEGLSYWHLTYPFNVPWTMVTADIGFAVLVNSARFPAFIRGQDVVAELDEVRARAAATEAQIAALSQAEADLRVSEERFRATFEQAAVGIAHTDFEGKWLRVNQKLCEIVGYTREELLQRTFQDITHPDDIEPDLALFQQLLAEQFPTYTLEKRYLHRDGSTVWIHLTVSLARDTAGRPEYCIGVIEDITARKQLEEQFFQAQKMEGIGRLAGGVAHDFNNLLAAILGYTELAEMKLDSDSPAHADLQQVQAATERAATLTRQLLAFARRQMVEPKVIDLNALLQDMAKLLGRLIGEDIDLVALTGSDLWAVKIDRGQLEQVLVNLAVNARDAMPKGGKLILETANVTLDAGYAHQHAEVVPGDYVMLAVSDTGTGMDAEVQKHIFEPFFTTKEKGKGTGLGLATCYGIVKQSGGHIWLYSVPGKGTTFKIYLPRSTEAVTGAVPREQENIPRGTETILLVEDEPMMRDYVVQALRAQGYTVLEAPDGPTALRCAAQYGGPIHLLLTDVVMPWMNGRDLAERLQVTYSDIKVIYMSGYTDNSIVHHGILEEGVAFLQKPYTLGVLARKVRAILDIPSQRDPVSV